MSTRTPEQVYQDLINAGFPPAGAQIMTAIAGAESGFNDTARGDLGLQNATWGPSYGLFQIRTLKSATGTGGDRDIQQLAASDAAQAAAAWDISHHGADFTPWTTYTSGAYQKFLGQAATAQTTAVTPVVNLPGPDWLWGPLPNFLNSQAGQTVAGVRAIALQAAFGVLGLGLLYAGAITLVRPHTDRLTGQVRAVATKVL